MFLTRGGAQTYCFKKVERPASLQCILTNVVQKPATPVSSTNGFLNEQSTKDSSTSASNYECHYICNKRKWQVENFTLNNI